ncbi:MAG: CoA pyrophosphatase [Chlorobi bacterium]|nr:CoA pyrophosphatase [Chlorobiota bacterium]
MNFETFSHKLSYALSKDLPGLKVQQIMLPEGREKKIPSNLKNVKKSAVMLLCYFHKNEIYIVLIKRAKDNGKHSGQIAFPGGGVESYDEDIIATAVRETNEEIGVSYIEIIGKLSPIYIPVSNYMMQPIVGLLKNKPNFVRSKNEVAEIYSINIKKLIEAKVVTKTFTINNETVTAPFYIVDNIEIWGATAMVLSEFIEILKNIEL